MDSLERLQKLAGPDTINWTTVQLEALNRDIDAMAALLLDFYLAQGKAKEQRECGSVELDVSQPDR
ncbi:MAG: hypothetical protein JO340_16070 [Acidobacteriaceae bacterium]|nr:hypothetical protein [Acidobacteriaceae bacterium]